MRCIKPVRRIAGEKVSNSAVKKIFSEIVGFVVGGPVSLTRQPFSWDIFLNSGEEFGVSEEHDIFLTNYLVAVDLINLKSGH